MSPNKPKWYKTEPNSRRIERKSVLSETGCWLWLGSVDSVGYPRMRIGRTAEGTKRFVRVHRESYQCYVGSIPPGFVIRHTCHNKLCVNPFHLTVGSIGDNTRDSSKLDFDKARKIRKGWANGETQRALAKRFGVGRSAIADVVHNRSWRDSPYKRG